MFEEIEKFKTSGPTEKQLTDEKEALLKEFDAFESIHLTV